MRKRNTAYGVALSVLAIGALALSGCGGGGGGGGLQLSGNVSRAEITRPAAAVSGASVQAFIWPDMTTVVATATTNASGNYALNLPDGTSGKDIVLCAVWATASGNNRLSAIIADVPSKGTSLADLDNTTTITAEIVADSATKNSLTDITSSAVETIASEVRQWDGAKTLNSQVDGTQLPSKFGAGLKSGSNVATYASTNTVIQNELTQLHDATPTNVKSARRMLQMLRDMGHGLMDATTSNNESLDQTARDQKQAIEDGMRAVSHDLVVRVVSIFNVLWWGGKHNGVLLGGNSENWDTLENKAPGNYDWQVSGDTRILTKTSDAADGKSWIVTSKIPDATLGWVITITPQNAISGGFQITRDAGKYTVAIRKPSQPTWKWDAELACVIDATTNTPSKVSFSLTANDPLLSKPLSFNGYIIGNPVGTKDKEAYSQATISGSLSSQFVSGQLGSATVQWTNNTRTMWDIQKLSISNFTFNTEFSKVISGSVTSGYINFYPADASQTDYFVASPKTAHLDKATFTVSNHSITTSDDDITFDRYVANGDVTLKTRTMKGTLVYTSPVLTFNGSLNATWDNLAVYLPNIGGGSDPTTRFPSGTVNFAGYIQPTSGNKAYASGSLVFNVNTADHKAYATLNIDKLEYASESMSGSMKAGFTVVGDNFHYDNPTFVLNLTQAPTGYVMHVEGLSNNLTGYIATDSTATTKVATIGKADTLGLNELGGALIVKYSDSTFETLISVLPIQ